jgi:hypothetical protein
MANIPAGSPLLWVHLASVYVVTVITLKVGRAADTLLLSETCYCYGTSNNSFESTAAAAAELAGVRADSLFLPYCRSSQFNSSAIVGRLAVLHFSSLLPPSSLLFLLLLLYCPVTATAAAVVCHE